VASGEIDADFIEEVCNSARLLQRAAGRSSAPVPNRLSLIFIISAVTAISLWRLWRLTVGLSRCFSVVG
jgi:hypothetical protein